MEQLFLIVLNMSITACYIVPAVLLIRLLLRRAPKLYSYLLWLPVFFRLACPVSFASGLSLIGGLTGKQAEAGGTMTYVPQNIGMMQQPTVELGAPQINAIINETLPAAAPAASANPIQLWLAAAAAAWLFGMAVLLIYAAVSYIRLRRRLSTAVLLHDNVYATDRYAVPFVAGIFAPKIYLPAGMAETPHILRHEQVHIRRGDYLVKPLAFLILTVHWFNPLAWGAYLLMGRDMEMSCDERVLGQLGETVRTDYSRSLLSVATRQFGLGIPLAFGESNVKARVKNALKYSKPARWAVVLAGLLCLLTVIACTADPKSELAFDAELAKQWASTFTTGETDRAKIGELAYSRYMEAFMGDDVPDEYRIDSYSVTSATLYSESETEFAVAITSGYACRSTYWLSANGEFVPRADGSGYDCTGDECFVYLRALGDGKYELYDKGTGGNFPGEPVDAALREKAEQDLAALMGQPNATRTSEIFLSTRNIAQAHGWTEFGPYNFGDILYSKASDRVTVMWQVVTGMSYPTQGEGQIARVELSYRLERATGRITEKTYTESEDAQLGLTCVQLCDVDEAFYTMSDARLAEIAEAMYQLMLETDITPLSSSAPEMYLELLEQNILYFANVDFVPEFSLYNEGGVFYYPNTNEIDVMATVSTGTSTGTLEGPRCAFTVKLDGSGSLVSRSYEPEPTNEYFHHVRDYDGSFQTATDARLVELGKMFYSIILNNGEVVSFNDSAAASDGTFTYDLTDLDQAIDWAILQDSKGAYYAGEFPVAAHRVFDTVVDGETTTAYIQSVYAEMSFENMTFVNVSGGAGPARLTFRKNAAGGYLCEEYKEALKDPRDIFTDKAYAAYLKQGGIEDLYAKMTQRCEGYLQSIGRSAAVSLPHSRAAYPQPEAAGIDAGKVARAYAQHPDYPDWIGTREVIKNGVRYIYMTSLQQENGTAGITFTAYTADRTGNNRTLYESSVIILYPAQSAAAASAYLWPLEDGAGEVAGSLTLYEGHTGADILAPRGTAVLAAADGIVSLAQAEPLWPYGRYLDIEHADGRVTRYAHLQSVAVSFGDEVKAGARIGTVGDSGNATTTHLHFELLRNGTPLDPLDYIAQ